MMPYTMTDEIAYKLGALDFPHFYQSVRWKLNKEPFELCHFFEWSFPSGTPCKKVGDDYVTDWDSFALHGDVKLDLIKDISHKLAYIRGRLSSYSVQITSTSIYVGYANSHNLRDFLAQCFHDVLFDRFTLAPQKEGELGRSFVHEAPCYIIVMDETLGTIPCTPHVTLTSTEEVICYIVGDKVVA